MSVIDEMLAYHDALAKSVKDPEKRVRMGRRRDALDVLRRMRNLIYRHGLVYDGQVCVNSRASIDIQDLLQELCVIDGVDLAAMPEGVCVEGPATRPMRTIGVVTSKGVLTDAAEIDSNATSVAEPQE